MKELAKKKHYKGKDQFSPKLGLLHIFDDQNKNVKVKTKQKHISVFLLQPSESLLINRNIWIIFQWIIGKIRLINTNT